MYTLNYTSYRYFKEILEYFKITELFLSPENYSLEEVEELQNKIFLIYNLVNEKQISLKNFNNIAGIWEKIMTMARMNLMNSTIIVKKMSQ